MNYNQHVKKVELKLSSQEKLLPLKYNKRNNYYEANWDTLKEQEDSDVSMHAVVTFANGQVIETAQTVVKVNNLVAYDTIKMFDFADSISGVQADGTWQASFGAVPLQHENGMLRMNVNLPGNADWEEARVKFGSLPELGQTSKVTLDILVPKATITTGGVRPYIVLNPGWIKEGVDKFRLPVSALPTTVINGVEYAKVAFEAEFSPVAGVNELFVGMVGDMLKYNGPIYIDNVTLYSKQ